MFRRISIWLGILFFLIPNLSVSAQLTSIEPMPYVYKIKTAGCTQPPNTRVQTGFRVKGMAGIVTALHGVAGCNIIVAEPGDDGIIYDDLIIGEVDVDNDMALLWSEQLETETDNGLEVITPPTKIEDYEQVQLIGYPYNLYRQELRSDVIITELTMLVNLLPEDDIKLVAKRNSPALTIQVLRVQSPLVPGHSGAPLINQDGRVVGVGNGGLDMGRAEMNWAIPWDKIKWKAISTRISAAISHEDQQRVEELESQSVQLFSFSDPSTATTTNSNRRGIISGRILNGVSPIPNLDLHLYDKAGKLESTSTDTNGEFEFKGLNPGNYFIDFSSKSGVGTVPVNLAVNSSLNIPIQLQDLVKVSFISNTDSSHVLFIDGRQMALVNQGNIYGSDDGDIIILGNSTVTNVFFLTPEVHSFEYFRIEVNDNKSNSNVQNLFEDNDESDIEYKIINTVDAQTRSFIADEDIYLKYSQINDLEFYKYSVSQAKNSEEDYIEFILNAGITGYKNENITASFQFQKFNRNLTYIPNAEDIKVDIPVTIEENLQELSIPMRISQNLFQPFEHLYAVDISIHSGEGNLLGKAEPQVLLFYPSNGRMDGTLVQTNRENIDQILDNLFWKYEELRWSEDFSTANDDLWFIGEDESWIGNVQDGVYTLANMNTANVAEYRWVEIHNDIGIHDLSNAPVSVSTVGTYSQNISGSGLIYRLNLDTKHYYAYVLGDQNTVSLWKRDQDGYQVLYQQVPSNLNTNAPNELGIVGDGSTLYLYVNKILLDKVIDDSIEGHQTGLISMGIGNYTFDDFKIYIDPRQQIGTEYISSESNARDYLLQGNFYYYESTYDLAIEAYSQAILINSYLVAAYMNRGTTYEQIEEYDRAIVDFTESIALDPNLSSAYYSRGNIYQRQGNDELAIMDYTKAIQQGSDFTEVFAHLALSYYNLGDYHRAINNSNRAIELNSTHALAYFIRGAAYEEQNKLQFWNLNKHIEVK